MSEAPGARPGGSDPAPAGGGAAGAGGGAAGAGGRAAALGGSAAGPGGRAPAPAPWSGTAAPGGGLLAARAGLGRFRRHRLAVAGSVLVALLFLVAALAPWLATHDPNAQELVDRLQPPSAAHWLGTDGHGRDVFSRLLFGARVSLAVALVAAAIAVGLGGLIGSVAGYVGGRVDWALMRFTDVVMTIPVLFLVLIIVAAYGASLVNLVVVLGVVYWPGVARLVRAQMLALRARDFVEAARALGARQARVLARHLVPNATGIVTVQVTLAIATAILAESALSFLGLGVPKPTPSWGNMLTEGRLHLTGAWWIATFPGIAIFLAVLGFNLTGDGLRDALDPHLR
jgi:peptide/nickel transport system permease protein